MRQRMVYIAAILLVIQGGLVVLLHQSGTKVAGGAPNTIFLEISPNEITRVEITDGDNQQLLLEKKDHEWLITSAFSAPADDVLVKELLSKLTQAKQGYAVATRSDAAGRFKTAHDDFERRILIKTGQQIVTDFYLGKSAGRQLSYVRKSGEPEVFTLSISSFDVEADADKWLAKDLFHIDADTVKTVKMTGVELQKDHDSWQIVGAEDRDLNTGAVDKLVKMIANLEVQSVLDPAEVSALFDNDPVLQFTISTDKENDIQYSFAQKDDFKVLKISTSERYFKVYDWQVAELQAFTPETMLKGS